MTPHIGQTPPAFVPIKNEAASADPFVWALEIVGPDGGPLVSPDGLQMSALRLTSHSTSFRWGTTTGGQDKEWWAVAMEFDGIAEAGDGSLSGIDLSISNAASVGQLWMERNDSFRRHRATVWLLNLSLLNDPLSSYSFPGRIVSVELRLADVRLSIASGEFGFIVPKDQIWPTCRHVYRSASCGFALDEDGAILGDCIRTLRACERRGELESALGVTVLHPTRFGGFVGGPRGRTKATS